MRHFVYVFILFPMLSFSQSNGNANDIVFEYYLDSVRIDMEKTILPSHLKDIIILEEGNIVKAYISSVKHNICLVDLNSISNEYNNLLKNKVIVVDDKVIKKSSEYLIDKNEIENVEITLSSEIEDQTTKFSIIKITTKSKQMRINYLKNKGRIMIRG